MKSKKEKTDEGEELLTTVEKNLHESAVPLVSELLRETFGTGEQPLATKTLLSQ